jgi:DUF218 domain
MKFIHRFHFILICLVFSLFLQAGISLCLGVTSLNESQVKLLTLNNPVQDKNFYFLTLIYNNPKLRKLLEDNPKLQSLANAKFEATKVASLLPVDSKENPLTAVLLSNDEIKTIEDVLVEQADKNVAFKALLDGPFIQSRVFYRYENYTNEEKVRHAWLDCAAGINNILQTYGLGQKARYALIDSPLYDVRGKDFKTLLRLKLMELTNQSDSNSLFFDIPLKTALGLLDINNRDEAGRFEPLETGENQEAYKQIGLTPWQNYSYSVILVPGAGPGSRDVALSAMGKLRLRIAYQRYESHEAPFIMVSGGYVHPAQTQYCEAYEMKKYLIHELHVPASAVIIEPHARHTTTNIRNCARIAYRDGIPFVKPVLVVSDPLQSAAIQSDKFRTRCSNEMHCVPYTHVKRISAFDTELNFTLDSLHYDNIDPLDP